MGWRTTAKGSHGEQHRDLRLVTAYKEVFEKNSESVELVLADLAQFTGFYQVMPPDTPPSELAHSNGLRAAFGRLFHFLSLTEDDLRELETAARLEARANNGEHL